MNGQDFRSSVRSLGGDRRRIWGVQMGAGRIARLKPVPPAARVGLEWAVLLGLEQCHGTGGVRVMPAKWQFPLRSSARRRLAHHAQV